MSIKPAAGAARVVRVDHAVANDETAAAVDAAAGGAGGIAADRAVINGEIAPRIPNAAAEIERIAVLNGDPRQIDREGPGDVDHPVVEDGPVPVDNSTARTVERQALRYIEVARSGRVFAGSSDCQDVRAGWDRNRVSAPAAAFAATIASRSEQSALQIPSLL
jgi:hypothetical protein